MKNIILTAFILLLLTFPAFAGKVVTQVISSTPPADGTWTPAISALHKNGSGFLNIGVSGTWASGTVTLQRQFQASGIWLDVTKFTENTQKALVDREGGVTYRIGMKSADYANSSVSVRISR